MGDDRKTQKIEMNFYKVIIDAINLKQKDGAICGVGTLNIKDLSKLPKQLQFLKKLKKIDLHEAHRQLKSCERVYKDITTTEKFWRYIYNMDWKNANKYHLKMNETDLGENEKMLEQIQQDKNVTLSFALCFGFGGDTNKYTGEEAYRQQSEAIKKTHDNRLEWLKLIKS